MRTMSLVPLVGLLACNTQLGRGPGGGPSAPGADPALPQHESSVHLVESTGGGGSEQVARTVTFAWRGEAFLDGMQGLAIQRGGDNASVGMSTLTCTVDTDTGNYTDDESYLPDDDYPEDWDDYDYDDYDYGDDGDDDDSEEDGDDLSSRLLLTGSGGYVGVVERRGEIVTYEVPHVTDAAFVKGGVVALSEGQDHCRVTRISDDGALTPQDLPAEACGGSFTVDPVRGVAWLANGDLWSVDVDGVATLVAAGAGDLVTFDIVSGRPVTATAGGHTVSALGAWTVQTDYPVRGIGNLGALGAIVVATDAQSATQAHLVALEGAWGGVMVDQASPYGFDSFEVDDGGSTLGLVLNNSQVVFYDITVR